MQADSFYSETEGYCTTGGCEKTGMNHCCRDILKVNKSETKNKQKTN